MKKKAEFNFKTFIINTLRRASYRYPSRAIAMTRARVARGIYKCATCSKTYPKSAIKLDHIVPVVALSGFTTWDEYISRMFPEPEGFQVMCTICHDIKTAGEREMRKEIRHLKKKKEKKDAGQT